MAQLGNNKYAAAELTDKLLNTETEIEKDLIKSIEMFKQVVTGDELSVEEKYNPRYIIKPFSKIIFGTNNLPSLEKIDDEGFYRRLLIIPFEKKFSQEEIINFDKNSLFDKEAINYLAYLALSAYQKMYKTKEFANFEENHNLILEYRKANDSAEIFINDDFEMNQIFKQSYKIPKTAFYGLYFDWCKEHNYYIKPKKIFYEIIHNHKNYSIAEHNGIEHVINLEKQQKNK